MENPTTVIKIFNAKKFLSSILYPSTICFKVILISIPKPFIKFCNFVQNSFRKAQVIK